MDVKSKFKIGTYFVFFLIPILTLAIPYYIFNQVQEFDSEIIEIFFPLICFANFIYILLLVRSMGNKILINNLIKEIIFTNVITQQTKTYSYSELDGFFVTYETEKDGKYRTLYLVKNGQLIQKISALYYSNQEQMEEGLMHLKLLEGEDLTILQKIKFLFRKM